MIAKKREIVVDGFITLVEPEEFDGMKHSFAKKVEELKSKIDAMSETSSAKEIGRVLNLCRDVMSSAESLTPRYLTSEEIEYVNSVTSMVGPMVKILDGMSEYLKANGGNGIKDIMKAIDASTGDQPKKQQKQDKSKKEEPASTTSTPKQEAEPATTEQQSKPPVVSSAGHTTESTTADQVVQATVQTPVATQQVAAPAAAKELGFNPYSFVRNPAPAAPVNPQPKRTVEQKNTFVAPHTKVSDDEVKAWCDKHFMVYDENVGSYPLYDMCKNPAFKMRLKQLNASCRPNNPHFVQEDISKYAPGSGYDLAFTLGSANKGRKIVALVSQIPNPDGVYPWKVYDIKG